jgi:hypothetical protein
MNKYSLAWCGCSLRNRAQDTRVSGLFQIPHLGGCGIDHVAATTEDEAAFVAYAAKEPIGKRCRLYKAAELVLAD